MNLIAFVKKWTLPCAMVFGASVYLMFAYIEPLIPVGLVLAPHVTSLLPVVIFIMLYVTFCKIQVKELRPHPWHFWLQLIRTLLSALLVGVILCVDDMEMKIILEGVFICVICPTASAAAVVTEKLGGSIASLTVYTIIANVVTSLIIPLFFPMVEKGADITFSLAFLMIFKRITVVLLCPLLLALLTRR